MSQFVEENVVVSVPEPEWTDTWHPVSHAKIVTALENVVHDTGISVIDRNYSASKDLLNVFGTWTLDSGATGTKWMIGFRNSIKKLFAIGFCSGNKVMNCSNMQFYGDDFTGFRRHTGGLTMETLIELVKEAFNSILDKFKKLEEWHMSLKEVNVREFDFKQLTFNAMSENIFPCSKFHEFVSCYEEERKENSDTSSTLYHFHGGVTRLIRNDSLFSISNRSGTLHSVVNEFKDKPRLVIRNRR